MKEEEPTLPTSEPARWSKLYEDLYVIYTELYELRHPNFGRIFDIVLMIMIAEAIIRACFFGLTLLLFTFFGSAILPWLAAVLRRLLQIPYQ